MFKPAAPPATARRDYYFLIGLALLMASGLLALHLAGDLTAQAGWYVLIFGFLFGLFWLAFRKTLRLPDSPALTLIILVFAGLFRLIALFLAPSLSSDMFRYIWEGQLVTEGISPYRYPPVDPALSAVASRSEVWLFVRQRETASPYPPLNQALGAVGYRLWGANLLGPKFNAALFDFLSLLILLKLLALSKLPRHRLILYAWCPLPIIEFAGNGHNDAPMLFLLLVALFLALQAKPFGSSLFFGLASLAKFVPLFSLPTFALAWVATKFSNEQQHWLGFWRKPAAWFWLGLYGTLVLLVITLGYLPFLVLGQGALGSIFEYTGSWLDNEAPFYHYLYYGLGLTVAKIASLLVLALGLAGLTFYAPLANNISLARRVMLAFGLTLLVASTVHVWYVSWLLIFLPLVYQTESAPFFKFFDLGWLWFTFLVQFSYLTYGGNLAHYQWIRWVEYLPLHALIFYGLFLTFLAKKRQLSS